MRYFPLLLIAIGLLDRAATAQDLPQTLDDRLAVTLFAAEPQIVTPCGIAVDGRGRVLVIESHTHFRPDNYEGPAADRIRLMEDTDGDGRADRITTFFEGTRSTMNLAVHPDGSVYVATRMKIFRLRDTDDDGVADENTPIAELETEGNYPHNGLSGFAFDFEGNVYFGFGENLGSEFKLIGSDGSSFSELEGGHVYRCRADGSQIERVAFGFWNPFHLAFDAFGRLFAVDNDPDALPPCRLLHVVDGGNYGYRFRNGRKGVHPFTAWNGELPGTLPMVAGTGEAPSGIVAYESDNLPADYVGNLLVTSWGDHRLERYRLEPRGASFQAVTEPFVKGDENFRPVGIAVAPDGALYVSDWVLRDYNVHGKGRIWRVSAKQPELADRGKPPTAAIHAVDRATRENAARELVKTEGGRQVLAHIATSTELPDPKTRTLAIVALASAGKLGPAHSAARHDPSPDVRMAAAGALGSEAASADLSPTESSAEVRAAVLRHAVDAELDELCWQSAASADAFLAEAAREGLYHTGGYRDVDESKLSPKQRLAELLILREHGNSQAIEALPRFLRDADPDVRFAAVQWIGEVRLTRYRNELAEALAAGPTTERIFAGYLAALERLDGRRRGPSDEWAGEQYMVRVLEDPESNGEVRRWALRMLRPDHPLLTLDRLQEYLASDDSAIQLEALRTLRDSRLEGRQQVLVQVATSADYSPRLRAEAIVGILPTTPESRHALLKLAAGDDRMLRNEALRSLRGAELDPSQRAQIEALAQGDGDSRDLAARVLQPAPEVDSATSRDVEHWLSLLEGDAPAGDPQAGERVFFHMQSAACARCHQVAGRGGRIGPELTATTGALGLRRLVESIVRPGQEIAPQFVSWLVVTTSGESLTGVLVDELATGEQTYADQNGKLTQLKPDEIESRRPLPTSLMPEGLPAQMTAQEFRDLIAYLRGQGREVTAAVGAE